MIARYLVDVWVSDSVLVGLSEEDLLKKREEFENILLAGRMSTRLHKAAYKALDKAGGKHVVAHVTRSE